MTPRPFPWAIGLGTDLCRISRIANIITNTDKDGQVANRFISRILTGSELPTAHQKLAAYEIALKNHAGTNIESSSLQALSQFLAGRWAAKEATKKAVSAQLGWHDIVVEVTHGQPYVVFRYPYRLRHEEALSADAGRFDDYEERAGKLSISHDGDYAVATVLVDLGQ